jgi:hypothetical protein
LRTLKKETIMARTVADHLLDTVMANWRNMV